MSEFMFLAGKGHLGKRADQIARKHGAYLVNYTDPGCGCGYGCTGDCPENRRHWFCCANLGEPFDSATARAVEADLRQAKILKSNPACKAADWRTGSRHPSARSM